MRVLRPRRPAELQLFLLYSQTETLSLIKRCVDRVHLFRHITFSGFTLRLAEGSFACLAGSIRTWHGITILHIDEMAARWFPRISRIARFACLPGSFRRWHGITILRLDEMAALWFPRISRMLILTTNLAWCFEDDHIR